LVGTVILTRVVCVLPLSSGAWVWSARRRGRREEAPPWQGPAVLSWMGLRGAVTLAAALALPLTTDAGGAFPNRDLIIFLAFAVIVATLVVQGLTLPAV